MVMGEALAGFSRDDPGHLRPDIVGSLSGYRIAPVPWQPMRGAPRGPDPLMDRNFRALGDRREPVFRWYVYPQPKYTIPDLGGQRRFYN